MPSFTSKYGVRAVRMLLIALFAMPAAAQSFAGVTEVARRIDGAVAAPVIRGYAPHDRLATLTRRASAPAGYLAFCRRSPAACGAARAASPDHAALEPVRLTSARLAQLDAINRAVNARVHPLTDEILYGEIERWTRPARVRLKIGAAGAPFETLAGDCEDYVLMKRDRLIASGWPASALLITVVRDLDDLGHAVLTVVTDRGDLVLDNQAEDIAHWRATGYAFIKRQSMRDPALWVSLGMPVRPVETTAGAD